MADNTCVIFKYSGKYAHFLRAEANASAPSYPFPPRTALLGLLGTILGFEKDRVQATLSGAGITVTGGARATHWHTANLRKFPPAPLPYRVKRQDRGSAKNPRNTRIAQEWLIKPEFTVYAQLPEPFHTDLLSRLRSKRWHFTPCLGLSEMIADLEYRECVTTRPLPPGRYEVHGPVQQDRITLDVDGLLKRDMGAKSIRMPRSLTPDRKFSHATYVHGINGSGVPVETADAVDAGGKVILWM